MWEILIVCDDGGGLMHSSSTTPTHTIDLGSSTGTRASYWTHSLDLNVILL